MKSAPQSKKAVDFYNLHTGKTLLVLPNIWDVIGARMLEKVGYPAVATASAAVSASLGYADGERIKRATLYEVARRIAGSVNLPVTVDIERGYGESISELKDSIHQLISTGAVGINIEDSIIEGEELRRIKHQCERIQAIREVADEEGIHLFINARIDSFLSPTYGSNNLVINDAIARAKEYNAAGADCVYPIGPGDEYTVKKLREEISSPINILATENACSLKELQNIGINRVSFGPFIFRSCYRKFLTISEELSELGDYKCFSEALLSGEEIKKYLNMGHEP